MARKRRSTKTTVKRVYTSARKGVRRYKRTGGEGKLFQPDAMLYGGLRQRASDWLQKNIVSKVPFLAQLPLGLADEVAMGLINYYGAKKLKGFAKKVAMKGLVIENARVGEAISQGIPMASANANTSSSNGNVF